MTAFLCRSRTHEPSEYDPMNQSAASTARDLEAAEQKYAEEREKRLRPDGNDQFRQPTGELAHFLDDPHGKGIEREPIEEEIDVAVLGSGFGGLMVAGRLRELGLERIRLIDQAGGVGGTWYWNQYPGAQCDIESYIYLPMLEETGYMPKEKYAYAAEIREHTRRIADHYALAPDILFHTRLTEARWDEEAARWIVETDRGDCLAARFLCASTGPVPRLKLPGVPGIERFRGHSFHSSRWDYGYTGGTETGGMTRLADKRVGIIGTGCTGIQLVPYLARDAKELFVFQRTPSTVDPRNNRPTDPEWVKTLEPGWQRRRMENFNNLTWYHAEKEDLVGDAWTELFHRTIGHVMAADNPEQVTSEDWKWFSELANFERMEALRKRVDDFVDDPETAEALKPWYQFFCKRPAFHDEYLQTFNRENVTLVDTQGQGVEQITEYGVVVDGQEYELDCLIYATGFEVGTSYTRKANFDAIGRKGVKLSEHWEKGLRTFHSHMTDGFPNLFFLMSQQGGLPYNFTHLLDEVASHIRYVIDAVQASGAVSVEPLSEAVDAWVEEILASAEGISAMQANCTPGYYNGEGQPDLSQLAMGPKKYFRIIDAWRKRGDLEGMILTDASGRRVRAGGTRHELSGVRFV